MTLQSGWQRRRSKRVEGLWIARYRVDRSGNWSNCTVLDVSEGGAGLALPPDIPYLDGTVEIDLRTISAPRRRLLLRGHVRNGYVLPDGWHRIGVEFTNLRGMRRRRLTTMLSRAAD